MDDERVEWVDYVKVIACILVVLGHFFQSMTKAGILPDHDLYRWFNQTIYYFHVSLFFICSGYLYERYSRVFDLISWERSVCKKALALGVPYLTFSVVTWLFKTLLTNDVNDQVDGIVITLLQKPISPYWYLYCLFFIFLITPTFRSAKETLVGIVLAILLKVLTMSGFDSGIYAISSVCGNLILFVLGMAIVSLQVRLDNKITIGILCGITFLALSIVCYVLVLRNTLLEFVMTILACTSIITMTAAYEDRIGHYIAMRWMAGYTLPIYLMHTLFAAPIRIVLLKVGVTNAIVHVLLGILGSMLGPVIAAVMMRRLKYPEFVLYPGRFVRI